MTKPRKLGVVTCHFNPCRYTRPVQNYIRFAAGIAASQLELYTVELAFDDEPFQLCEHVAPDRHLRYRVSSKYGVLWQKERLLNLGLAALPDCYDAVAWIDADLLFANQNWPEIALQKLSETPVVQLFSRVMDTDATGQLIAPPRSGIGHVLGTPALKGQYGRPGGAWAAWRETIVDGLYDRHVLGGGDSIMVHAWQGKVQQAQSYAGLKSNWLNEYAARQTPRVQGRIGYVPGDAVHLYHGTRARRRYVDRYQILRRGGYDPATDITDDNGPLTWSEFAQERKPKMIAEVARYFATRQEDS
ncbi:hypothetical protein [Thalassoroseus pseudoceratinae]|uniref:hypothetical protein n=1 Tax=Thalassoroseus pseudoceratinae TaxID=2713176 RepID=UPI001421EA84|nr:hypothetical protein [Thalassoroseus pseudoceratinae]